MAVVQTAYPVDYDAYVAGQIADTQTCDVDSRTLTGSAVPFGYAVQPGSGDREIALGIGRPTIALLNETGFDASETDLTYDGATRAIRVGEYVVLEDEIMHVSAVTATTLTVARGQLGTAGAAHADNTAVQALDEVLFAGITVMDERLPASDDTQFTAGQTVPVLHRGDIAVQVSAAVSAGGQVVATATAGTDDPEGSLSSRAVDGDHVAIPNARFVTSAAADGIAVVRIGGVIPTNV